MHLLDDVFYMYWRLFEILLLGLASKPGLHPVAIAHLIPDTISLVVRQKPNGGSKDIGSEYMNTIHFYPMLYMY
jgi:hypothetical protein